MGKFATFFKLFKENPDSLAAAVMVNLAKSSISHYIPDAIFLRWQYRAIFGEPLCLKNPKTFNEKLQWLKLYDRRPEQQRLVDKYDVREYISGIMGEEYLIPCLGVWEHVEDIDFASLPNRYVIKCTHDSGSVIICRNKEEFDVDNAKKKLAQSLKRNLFWHGREWPYKNLKPRIIVEQFMKTKDGQDLIDYKFFCFNGVPQFLYVSQGLSNHATAHISYASLEWEKEPFYREDFPVFDTLPEKPKTFEKMLEFSKILAKDFPFIRVDFYEIDGRLYFGELTFFPGAGFTKFYPDKWNRIIGDMIQLPMKNRS